MVHAVPADIAHGHLGLFRVLLDLLDQILTAVLGQLREYQADHTAVILGVDAQIGHLNRLTNVLQELGIPGLDHQGTGIGGRNGGDTIQGCLRTIVFHSDPVQNLGVGTARPDSTEFLVQVVQSLIHSSCVILEIDCHCCSPP